jgi:CDP-6-deoxy-D-xylo-4-hexulose-3-dehydrase
MAYRIPLAHYSFGSEEIGAAEQLLHSGHLTLGEQTTKFEQQLANMHGCRFAIFVNSGSSANLIAIEAAIYLAQLKPDSQGAPITNGDEVIIQGLNWPSTITPILNRGLKPIFCDVNLETLNADVRSVMAVRTARTRMVVAVPVLGNPEGLDELRDYCNQERLILIEDACESLGAVTARGRLVGTVGQAAALSFYFSHHISTIEGGAVLTDDPDLADFCFALRSHGWTRHLMRDQPLFPSAVDEVDSRFCFVLPGYNVRPTDLNAVIGQIQLAKLPKLVAARRRLAKSRIEAATRVSNLISFPGAEICDRHSWMLLPMLFPDRVVRDHARQTFEAAGIETRPIIVGNILRQPVAKMFDLTNQPELPICDAIFERGLMIGIDPSSDATTESYICEVLQKVARA